MTTINIKRYLTATAVLAATSLGAWSQGLIKEVEGIRDFAPDKRPATRMEVAPESVTPQWRAERPAYSATVVAVDVNPSLSVMDLTSGASIYPRPTTRGYAAAGYFPKGDIDLSAGYRIVDNKRLALNIWAQMCRNYFHGHMFGSTDNCRLTTTDIAAGASLGYSAGKAGVLTASTSYSCDMFNYPGGIMRPASQRVGIYRLNTGWEGHAGNRLTYGATGRLAYTDYAKDAIPAVSSASNDGQRSQNEISGAIGAWLDFRCSNRISLALNVGYEGASRNNTLTPEATELIGKVALILNKGVITLEPKVGFTGQKMSGHLGVNLAMATGNLSGTKVGADVAWNWLISPYFAINVKAVSGPVVNEFDRLYALNRYAMPPYGLGMSFIPLDAEASINLLSFKGFHMSVGAGFAAADDWIGTALYKGMPTFSQSDLKSLRYFVSAGYRYGEKIRLEVSFESNNSDYDYASMTTPEGQKYYEWTDKAYYRYADRAKTVVNASVTYHPIKDIAVRAGYQYRSGRTIAATDETGYPVLAPLGNLNQLTVGAHWQITDLIGVYADVEGICQRHYLQANGMPGQRLRPLVGLTLKF